MKPLTLEEYNQEVERLYKERDELIKSIYSPKFKELRERLELHRSTCKHDFEEKSCHIDTWKQCRLCGLYEDY